MSDFYRDPKNKWVGGVCAGIAEHFGWDVNTVRLATVVLTIVTTGWVVPILYFVLWLALPEKGTGRLGFDSVKEAYDDKVKPTVDEKVKPFYDAKVKPTVDEAFGKKAPTDGTAGPAQPTQPAEPAAWEQPYDGSTVETDATVETDSFDENATTNADGTDPFDLDEGRKA